MVLLRDTTCKIDESLGHLSSIEHLVVSMELGVGLFHQWNPELVMVGAMSVQWSLALSIVWDSCINNHILPAAIFEKLENCKSILDTVVDNQILQKLWVCALDKKRSKEPAVTEDTLFDISWAHLVS